MRINIDLLGALNLVPFFYLIENLLTLEGRFTSNIQLLTFEGQ